MCGIVGYVGKQKALPILMNGLKKLEYRGYDSAGVAYSLDHSIKIKKAVGKIVELEKGVNLEENTSMGIGHTRWATHGKVSISNCHPHKSGNIVIVHNGIIENYQELRNLLLENGYSFYGDTDSEVVAAYIDFLYQQRFDMVSVLTECAHVLKGSYAIVGMVQGMEDQLFVMKKDSPLVIGIKDQEKWIASDTIAFSNETNTFVFLKDREIGLVSCEGVKLYKDGIEQEVELVEMNERNGNNGKDGFTHYMLKEMFEQVSLVEKWNALHLDHLEELPDLSSYQKIHIVGCGTAYHAGMIGKYMIETYGDMEVFVFIASEYRYQKLFIDSNTLVIFVSQSGETADTLACVKKVKELGATTLGIVNVENSSIARCVDHVLYTTAGPEIAVASTKAYLSQIYIFSLLAFTLGLQKKKLELEDVKNTYLELPFLIQRMLEYDYDKMIEPIWKKKDIFYLGRNLDYVTMMEGALKLKEISYIHAEAFPAGELKHGTISLIEEDTPVLALLSQKEIVAKTLSNVEEVKSRGAFILVLVKEDLVSEIHLDDTSNILPIPSSIELLQPLLTIIPLQMIAYHVAKKRGVDIDQPRNLAKSVTVE